MEKSTITLAGEITADCVACKFSREDEPNPQTLQRVRRCYRFPPHVTTLPAGGGGFAQLTTFPQVSPGQWCYEFAPVPAKLES